MANNRDEVKGKLEELLKSSGATGTFTENNDSITLEIPLTDEKQKEELINTLIQENLRKAEEEAERRVQEVLKHKAEEEKRKAEEEAKKKAEEEEKRKAVEEARLKAEEEAKRKATEEAKKKAEEEAKRKATDEARLKAEEEAKRKAEEEAKKKAEEEAKRKAAEEARLKAEEEAKRKAEEEAKKKAEEEAKRKADEEARLKAEEEAKRKATEEAKKKAEKEAKKKAEEEAKRKAAEEAKKKAEEEAKRKAEEEAKAKKAANNDVVSSYKKYTSSLKPIKADIKKKNYKNDGAFVPNLKKLYIDKVRYELQEQFNYKSSMQIPRLVKCVVSVGCGEAVANKKYLDAAVKELEQITGQHVVRTKARKAIANFKIRQGMEIGAKVTLRSDNMWYFLERLIRVALPRVRDFRGVKKNAFDGNGNYSLGISEQIIFPEIDFDKIERVSGLNIAIITTANTDKEAFSLLKNLGMPFQK